MKLGPPDDFQQFQIWLAFVLFFTPTAVYILRLYLTLAYRLTFGYWPY